MSIDSSLLYTKGDGRQGFIHDTYISFFLAKGFANRINDGRLSIPETCRNLQRYETAFYFLPNLLKGDSTIKFVNILFDNLLGSGKKLYLYFESLPKNIDAEIERLEGEVDLTEGDQTFWDEHNWHPVRDRYELEKMIKRLKILLELVDEKPTFDRPLYSISPREFLESIALKLRSKYEQLVEFTNQYQDDTIEGFRARWECKEYVHNLFLLWILLRGKPSDIVAYEDKKT